MSGKHFFPLAASQYNLRRLLIIRVIVFLCQLLALTYAWYFLELSLNYVLLSSSLLVLVLINCGVYFRLVQNWVVSDLEFLGHLVFDVLGLSLLLYLSGGANNPFVSYFLVPVTISAAILPWSYTWIVAGTSLLSYSLLLFLYLPLPELMPMDMAMDEQGDIPSLHIVGMWFNFLVSAALITYFVVKMAEEIRTQADKLTNYREENLRDEQILAVATQAAGTAHELGTPLSTVSVLLTEMELDHANDQGLQKDIALIKQQIARCKKSLKELVIQADFRHGGALRKSSVQEFIQQIIEQWQLIRPEVALNFNDAGADSVDGSEQERSADCPEILIESTLQQAIVNMLNNAADASPAGIDVKLFWSREHWNLHIRDYGEGINQEIADQLGTKFISTKKDGLGVGLVLSQASINRLGGKVRLYQHEEKGTVTAIQLPINDLSGDKDE